MRDLTSLGRFPGGQVDAGARTLIELGYNVIGDGRTVVVEDLAGAEALDMIEASGRASGDDFEAGSLGQLNGVATNSRTASPDQDGFARASRIKGRER